MGILVGVIGKISSGKDEITNMLNYLITTKHSQIDSMKPTFEDYMDRHNRVPYLEMLENIKFASKLKEVLAMFLGVDVKMFEDREFKNTPIEKLEMVKLYYSHNISYETYSFIVSKELKDIEEYRKAGYSFYKEEKIEVTPRYLMTNIGTDAIRRVVSQDWWVLMTFNDFCEVSSNWLVSDIRFKNEVDMVKKHNGFTIGVRRPFGKKFPRYDYLSLKGDKYAIPIGLSDVNPDLYKELTHVTETLDETKYADYIIENDGSLEDLFEEVRFIVDNELYLHK